MEVTYMHYEVLCVKLALDVVMELTVLTLILTIKGLKYHAIL